MRKITLILVVSAIFAATAVAQNAAVQALATPDSVLSQALGSMAQTRTCSVANAPVSSDMERAVRALLTNPDFIHKNPKTASLLLGSVTAAWPGLGESLFNGMYNHFNDLHDQLRTDANERVQEIIAATSDTEKDKLRLGFLSNEAVDAPTLLSAVKRFRAKANEMLDDEMQNKLDLEEFLSCAKAMGPSLTIATRLYPEFGREYGTRLHTIIPAHDKRNSSGVIAPTAFDKGRRSPAVEVDLASLGEDCDYCFAEPEKNDVVLADAGEECDACFVEPDKNDVVLADVGDECDACYVESQKNDVVLALLEGE